DYGFGRAHHRVLHFVNRRPGLTVAELLDVLQITKQSLARVLKQLIDTGHVIQGQGPRDRRQRELYPTGRGRWVALAVG
ncbi:MarR family transcriptional regulator, partial [Rhizobiaceae sp. 2RAB30]